MKPASGRAAGVVLLGGGALVAAVFGLAFQSLLAFHFGAGAETDAWFMSLSIYAFLAKFLMLTHLKSVALPLYDGLGSRDPAEARRFAVRLLAWAAAGGAALCLLLVTAAPFLVDALAPGYQGAQRALTVTLVRIRTPGLAFLATTAAGLAVLESRRRFGVTVASQKIVPAAVMLGAFALLADRGGMVGVGWIGLAGGVAGGLVTLAAVAPHLRRGHASSVEAARAGPGARLPDPPDLDVAEPSDELGPMSPPRYADPPDRPVLDADGALADVGRRWLQFGGSNAATFVGEWAFRIAASLLPVGLFSGVLYGRMVHDLLHAALNDATQTVALPALSAAARPLEAAADGPVSPVAAARDARGAATPDERVGATLRSHVAGLVTLTLPAAAFVAAAAPWIVALLFGRGRFVEDGMVGPSSLALRVFALGFLIQGVNQLVFSAAFASGRSHLVNRVQIVGHLARAAALVPAVWVLSYVGLVAAQVAMNALVLALLALWVPRAWGLGPGAAVRRVWGIAGATVLALGVHAAVATRLADPLALGTVGRAAVVSGLGLGWIVVYGAAGYALRVGPIRSAASTLRRRWGGVAALVLGLLLVPGPFRGPGPVAAQTAGPSPVPVDHWVLRVLEAGEARGTVPVGSAGTPMLPGTRVEALLRAAAEAGDPFATAALERFLREFGARAGRPPLTGWVGGGGWKATGDDAPPPDDGASDAPAPFDVRTPSGPWAGGGLRYGRPGARLWADAAWGVGQGTPPRLSSGAVGVRVGPLALEAGRRRARLGGAEGGALVLGADASLDGLVLRTLTPFDVGFLGRVTLTAGLFPRGFEQDVVEDPWFSMLRVTAAPSSSFQVGFSRAAQIGGRFVGGTAPFQTVPIPPDESPVGFGDVLGILVGRVTGYDNQVWAGDAAVGLAGAGLPVRLFAEVGLEDNERSFGDGAVQAGALVALEAAGVPAELRYTYTGIGDAGRWCRWCDTLPAFWYQHTRFQEGWRTEDRLLGHPLGGYGRMHALDVYLHAPTLRGGGRVGVRRIRRDSYNLLAAARPGAAWGFSADAGWAVARRAEVRLLADVERGGGGWRAGGAGASIRVLLGGFPPSRP